MNVVRRKVSLNKKRYVQDGFDLDLTYIMPNVIAMGFPAVGMEGLYRNPRSDVKRFFEMKHSKHYKVFNLCIEKSRAYEPEVFDMRTSRYPFQDHQAPPLEMMGQFCNDAEKYIKEEQGNVVAVHCKAGKGRAGMMICCYLVHSKAFPNAEEAMIHYAKTRTSNMEGVTIPSQRRYVTYYSDIVNYGFPKQPKIKLSKIKVQTSKYVQNISSTQLYCIVHSRKAGLENEMFKSAPANCNPSNDVEINVNDLEVEGDVKVVFFDKSIDKEKEVFHCWFNTGFIDKNFLKLTKPEIDKAWHDRKNKKYKPDFEIHLEFKDAETSPMSKLIAKKEAKDDKKEKKSKKEKKEKKSKKPSEKSNGTPKEEVKKETKEVKNENKKAEESKSPAPEEVSPKGDKRESEETVVVLLTDAKDEQPKKGTSAPSSPRGREDHSSADATSDDSGEDIGIPLPPIKADSDYVFKDGESNSDNESSSSSEDEHKK